MRHSYHLSIVACFFSFLTLFATPSRAVVIEAGRIETSGTTATIDLIYFSIGDLGSSTIAMSPFCGSCGVLTTERSGLALYVADASGGIGAYITGDPGDAATRSSTITENLAIGNYVLAVSWFELLSGELGPTQIDANINIAFDYEVGFSGSAGTNALITCKASGNLDGSFSLDIRSPGAICKLPSAAVPEPVPLALAALGFGAFFARRWRGSRLA